MDENLINFAKTDRFITHSGQLGPAMTQELTEKEKTVVLSLMMNPEHSDTERASSVSMNIFTYNKIKNHLLKNGLLRKEFVPNYGILGFEIFLSSFGNRIQPYMSGPIDMNFGHDLLEKVPSHLIFFLSEPGQGLGFHALEDFTSMKSGFLQAERRLFDTLKMERNEMSIVPFSFRELKIGRMFDLYRLVCESFRCSVDVERIDPKNPGQEVSALSWREFFERGSINEPLELGPEEWRILVNIVKHPLVPDQVLAEKGGMSRYRMRRIRDEIFGASAVKPVYIPNPTSIGLDVLIFTHLRFKPSVDMMEHFENLEDGLPANIILTIMDKQDAIGIGLFPTLKEGSKAQTDMFSAMQKMNLFESTPHVQVFSLDSSASGWPLTLAGPLEQKGNWSVDEKVFLWLKDLIP